MSLGVMKWEYISKGVDPWCRSLTLTIGRAQNPNRFGTFNFLCHTNTGHLEACLSCILTSNSESEPSSLLLLMRQPLLFGIYSTLSHSSDERLKSLKLWDWAVGTAEVDGTTRLSSAAESEAEQELEYLEAIFRE